MLNRWLVLFWIPWALALGAEPTLVERLGYPAGSRLLIINGDDAGMCHTANVATIESMERTMDWPS